MSATTPKPVVHGAALFDGTRAVRASSTTESPCSSRRATLTTTSALSKWRRASLMRRCAETTGEAGARREGAAGRP